MGIFKSVVSTCEAVGKACGRRAISDRDMRSERPGFERCPLPVCHWAGLRCGPDKHSEIEKKCKVEKLPDSVVKSETANAQSVLCLVQLRSTLRVLCVKISLRACGPSRSLRRVRSSPNQLQNAPEAAPCSPCATWTTCRAENPVSTDTAALNGSSAGDRSFAGDAVAFDEE